MSATPMTQTARDIAATVNGGTSATVAVKP